MSLRAIEFIVRLLSKGDRLTDRIELSGGLRMRAPDLILRREKLSEHHSAKATKRIERLGYPCVVIERQID